MESIESLIDALEDYEGTAMVVTHDEELLHAFATKYSEISRSSPIFSPSR